MTVTLRDTVTGSEVTIQTEADPGWWEYGNGSCDCNRAIEFPDVDEEMDAAMRAEHPDLPDHVGLCYGAKRFLIVACDCLDVTLAELNSDYPPDLLACHLTDSPSQSAPTPDS
jgi:uncharacterized membrane protein